MTLTKLFIIYFIDVIKMLESIKDHQYKNPKKIFKVDYVIIEWK